MKKINVIIFLIKMLTINKKKINSKMKKIINLAITV